MGGEINGMLEIVMDMLGVQDVESFISALVAMRDEQHKKMEAARG